VKFDGPVGQAIQADSVQVVVPPSGGRVLNKRERIELNDAVKSLEQQDGEPGWRKWRFIHQVLCVSSVDEIRVEQLDGARALLQLMSERSELARQLAEQALVDVGNVDLSESRLIHALRGRVAQLETQLQAAHDQAGRLTALQQKLLANADACPGCMTLEQRRRNWARIATAVGMLAGVLVMALVLK